MFVVKSSELHGRNVEETPNLVDMTWAPRVDVPHRRPKPPLQTFDSLSHILASHTCSSP